MTETIYSKSSINTINSSSSKRGNLLLALVILAFTLARLWRLTASCLWFDEIFSVHAAEHSWRSMLHFVAADLVHPPLFYILLKFWIGIGGESLLWLRLFPVLLSIAAVGPILLLARELKLSSAETTLGLLLLALNGYLIKYAQELRMYSLLFFLSTCSLWLFVSWWRSENGSTTRLIALTAINLMMVYTQYFVWLLVLLQFGIAVARYGRQRRPILLSFAILLGSYIPWLVQIAHAYESNRLSQNIGWITRPGVWALIELATLLNQPFVFPTSSADTTINLFVVVLVILIFGCPLALLIWQLLRKPPSREQLRTITLLVLFALAPVVSLATLSWIMPRSIWGTRHLIIIFVPYELLTAVAIIRLQPYWARVTVFLVAGCWFSMAAVYVVIRPVPVFIWCAWTPLAERVVETTGPSSQPTSIYAFEDLVAYHLWFALKNAKTANFRISVIKGLPGMSEDAAYFLPRDFEDISIRPANSAVNDNQAWIAFRAARLDEHQPPLDSFTNAGYEIESVFSEPAQNQDAFLIKLQRKKE